MDLSIFLVFLKLFSYIYLYSYLIIDYFVWIFLSIFTLNSNVSHINVANLAFCLHLSVIYFCVPLLSNSVFFVLGMFLKTELTRLLKNQSISSLNILV